MNLCALNFIDKCLTPLHLQMEPFNYERWELSYTPSTLQIYHIFFFFALQISYKDHCFDLTYNIKINIILHVLKIKISLYIKRLKKIYIY